MTITSAIATITDSATVKGNLISEHSTRAVALETLKVLWLREKRGVLREVSKQLKGCTPQFAGMVYRGERRSRRVEELLGDLGAPGFPAFYQRRRKAKADQWDKSLPSKKLLK